jgi:tetratricopeptide (TPR) repeat protein
VVWTASGSADYGWAQVGEIETGQVIGPRLQHDAGVWYAEFSPDGRCVVTAAWDNTARVWDAETGRPLTPPMKHGESVEYASFSPDGRSVVTASRDRTARVWDASTGEPISPILRHKDDVYRAVFSADGKRVITITRTGELRSWDLPREDHPLDELVGLAQWLSRSRIDPQGGQVRIEESFRNAYPWLRKKYPEYFAASLPDADADWHERQAAESEAAENWFAALFHLDRLAALRPPDGVQYQRRGRAHVGLNQWGKAARDYTKAIEQGTDGEDVRFARAVAELHLKEWDKAKPDLDRALESAPANSAYLLARSLAFARQGEKDRASADIVQALKHSSIHPSLDYPLYWGVISNTQREVTSTPEWRTVADIFSTPSDAEVDEAWVWRGLGLANACLGNWRDAVNYYSKALDKDRNEVDSFVGRAFAYAKLGQAENTVADCTRAIELKMDSWEIYYLRGLAYLALNQREKSAADFAKAVDKEPRIKSILPK